VKVDASRQRLDVRPHRSVKGFPHRQAGRHRAERYPDRRGRDRRQFQPAGWHSGPHRRRRLDDRGRTVSGSLALPLCISAGGISLPAPDLVPNVGGKVPSRTTVPRQSGRWL